MSGDQPRTDVLIMGGGLVGLALSLALSRSGLTSAVIDRGDGEFMQSSQFDGRASAISSSSWNMLDHLGLAGALTAKACPIERISVCEALKPGALDFGYDSNDGQEHDIAGPGEMGAMLANEDLRAALYQAAQDNADIALLYNHEVAGWDVGEHAVVTTLSNGQRLAGGLLVGADGRNSAVRQKAGITLAHWQYGQNAVVCAIAHERPHDNTAYQIFYPQGPLAILPLRDDAQGRHCASVVWTVSEDRIAAYLALSNRAFAAELQKQMGGFLDEVSVLGPRSSYPLGYHQSAHMSAMRVALVGDAAHVIHPIAGQGLNLGLRDVAALAQVLGEGVRLGLDSGDAQLLARYESWRGLDNIMMGAATDGLNRLFGVPGKTASALRRMGMGMIAKSGLAREFILREAKGESGDLPKLLLPS